MHSVITLSLEYTLNKKKKKNQFLKRKWESDYDFIFSFSTFLVYHDEKSYFVVKTLCIFVLCSHSIVLH